MARQSREGEILAGKYRLERLLGRGAVGFVYRAQNTLIGRTVAIKLLRPEHATDDTVVARFLREARAANMVRHPNVVDVLDIGQDDEGVPFIVEEFLEGEDLACYVKNQGGRLAPARALDILIPVAEAVGFAHSKGVVHRDLKPENVYLARAEGRVVPKLLDFGLSRIKAGSSEIRVTATGVTMGSPAY
ncbi:MAG TPA: serine/threonine-protein kinase, partial [Polyangiaceae bacterium]|nr:serine/threonine-protein kinase [Polyangiaceae bacterium]